MQCLKPTKFPNQTTYNVCGQCMPCRIRRRKEWETRLMLEWKTWNQGAFVTLTYSPEYLPDADQWKGGNLIKSDLQKFMKRFRKYFNEKYGDRKIRFFGCGEYGTQSKRAHFHILIFNNAFFSGQRMPIKIIDAEFGLFSKWVGIDGSINF